MGIGSFFRALLGQVVHESLPGERVAVAMVDDVVIARTDAYKKVEGNVYFPPEAVDRSYVHDSSQTTLCPWKGVAMYYDLAIPGRQVKDAAWYYPNPKDAAEGIRDHVAFDRRVTVREMAPSSD
ncbi:MAG: DUF427 domain-containing protein [Dehalococcoidia bacterium]|jgi:uncharacterized protein (DUF427 family)|nr:DUF427 domain-containing protein [Dehalococcoidia bacterium]